MSDLLNNAPLGRDITYPERYDPELLFALPRAENRKALTLPATWYGADIWNAYEMSWLDSRGKPIVAVGTFIIPHDSPCLIESKSFKLYLNSWNQETVDSSRTLEQRMANDLSQAAGAPVAVTITEMDALTNVTCRPMGGESIDAQEVTIQHYTPEPNLLACNANAQVVSETLTSDLLKSNCPVTGQPDWGSVQIQYRGHPIDRAALLAYIVSMRRHTEFHEHCVEKIYSDIMRACAPEQLLVYARYTRRGGLDINPWRSSHPTTVDNVRTPRQ